MATSSEDAGGRALRACTTAVGPSRRAGQRERERRSPARSRTVARRNLRGISERMLNAIAFTVVLARRAGHFSLPGLAALQPAARGHRHVHARSHPRAHPRAARLRLRAGEVHPARRWRIVRERTAGWLHFFVFWGFVDPRPPDRHHVRSRLLERLLPLPVHARACSASPYWLVRDLFEAHGLRLHRDPAHALARHPAAPAVRLRAGRGAPPPPLPLGGVPDPRLHRR